MPVGYTDAGNVRPFRNARFGDQRDADTGSDQIQRSLNSIDGTYDMGIRRTAAGPLTETVFNGTIESHLRLGENLLGEQSITAGKGTVGRKRRIETLLTQFAEMQTPVTVFRMQVV